MRKMCKDCDHEPVCGYPHTEHTLGCDYWQAERVMCKDCGHAVVVRNKGDVMYIGCGYFPNSFVAKNFWCANGERKGDHE